MRLSCRDFRWKFKLIGNGDANLRHFFTDMQVFFTNSFLFLENPKKESSTYVCNHCNLWNLVSRRCKSVGSSRLV